MDSRRLSIKYNLKCVKISKKYNSNENNGF